MISGADRGHADDAPVEPRVVTAPQFGYAQLIVKMRIVGVVGEAILLFLGIVQDETKLHALAGHFAIGEASEAGQNRGKAAIQAFGGNVRPRRIIRNAPAGRETSGFGNPYAVAYDTKRQEILVPN